MEVFLTIKGERHSLWLAVDQDGNVLDILVQRRRDKKAAKKFRKLRRGLRYVPRVIVTDKLESYGAAKREILPGIEHRQHRYLYKHGELPQTPAGAPSLNRPRAATLSFCGDHVLLSTASSKPCIPSEGGHAPYPGV